MVFRDSIQLVDGVGDIVARALAQEHQRTRDGLVKLDARRVKQHRVRFA